jgi:hypothetical protein
MIIIIFILYWLGSTQLDHSNMWPEPYLGSTPESSFKIMIRIIFALMLTQVNNQPHSWPGLCSKSTIELSFKIIIITIFILTCIRGIFLKLRVFYKDILGIKNNKYCLWRHVLSAPHVLEVQKFIQKNLKDKFILCLCLFLQLNTFLFSLYYSIFSVLE